MTMNRFFYELVSAKPLSFFRAVWGMFLIYYYLDAYWILQFHYGPEGIHDTAGLGATPPIFQWSLFYYLSPQPVMFPLIYGLAILSSLGLCLGLKTRACSVVSWICTISLITPLHWGANGADGVVKILAFLFMVCGVTGYTAHYFSLDAARPREKGESEKDALLIPSWTYRLFQIQLCAIYLSSGLQKAGATQWKSGTAMSSVLQQTESWMRYDFTTLCDYPAVIALLTTSALLFELILFPILVWISRTRLIALGLGVAFHLAILLTMRVFNYTEVMIVFYLCFLTEKEVDTVVTAVLNSGRNLRKRFKRPKLLKRVMR